MQRSRAFVNRLEHRPRGRAVSIIVAVVAQLVSSVAGAIDKGRDVVTTVANFFSFFTILSNVSASIVLLLLAVRFLRRRSLDVDPPALATVLACFDLHDRHRHRLQHRAASRGLPLQPETVGWSNEIMHVWGPLFLLLDVLLGSGASAPALDGGPGAAIFPRRVDRLHAGARAAHHQPHHGAPFLYPYPFLNPNEGGGWGSVVVYIVVIAVVIVGLAYGVVATAVCGGGARSEPSRGPCSGAAGHRRAGLGSPPPREIADQAALSERPA